MQAADCCFEVQSDVNESKNEPVVFDWRSKSSRRYKEMIGSLNGLLLSDPREIGT